MLLILGLTLSLPDLPDLRGSQYAFSSDRQKSKVSPMHRAPLTSQTINKWFVQPDLYRKDNVTKPETAGIYKCFHFRSVYFYLKIHSQRIQRIPLMV